MNNAPKDGDELADLTGIDSPRRPWRRISGLTMMATSFVALMLLVGLAAPARYATQREEGPRALGELRSARLDPALSNHWIQGTGILVNESVEYRRPLDRERYRLSAVQGMPNLWVELRVVGEGTEHYLPPESFVGRLIPVSDLGLTHAALPRAWQQATGKPLPAGGWILLDGHSPGSSRWVLGVWLLCAVFLLCNLGAMIHLLRPQHRIAVGQGHD